MHYYKGNYEKALVYYNSSLAIKEELGDLLFSVVNFARHLHIDPEQALVNANRKFEKRFRKMECDITESGASLSDFDIDSLEAKWQSAKDKVSD